MKIKIKHIDGITDVMAKVHKYGNEINLEYRFEGMTYGRMLTVSEFEAMRMKTTGSNDTHNKDDSQT